VIPLASRAQASSHSFKSESWIKNFRILRRRQVLTRPPGLREHNISRVEVRAWMPSLKLLVFAAQSPPKPVASRIRGRQQNGPTPLHDRDRPGEHKLRSYGRSTLRPHQALGGWVPCRFIRDPVASILG